MGQRQSQQSVGVFLHVFYLDVLDEILASLANIRRDFRVYISTDSEEKKAAISAALKRGDLSCEWLIKVLPNQGRDIAPFLIGFKDEILEHDICLRLHTKKSTHAVPEWGNGWRRHLISELIGTLDRCDLVFSKFTANPQLGFLTAIHWPHISHWVSAGENYELLQSILARVGIELGRDEHIEFPSGGMFWFRSAAIKPLLDLNLSWDDFAKSGAEDRDATLAHAIERSFFYFGAAAQFFWAVIPTTTSANTLSAGGAIALLRDSGLFDKEFYLERNPDVAAAGVDPLEHYFSYGYREGRNPSINFETEFYAMIMNSNEEINPLLHYLLRGRQAGLQTSSSTLTPDRTRSHHQSLLPRFKKIARLVNSRP